MPGEFDLSKNPFYLIGASLDTPSSELAELHEDALTDERASEIELDRALQLLMTPKLRIEAEVSWFPAESDLADSVLIQHATKDSLADALSACATLAPLPKANLAAHLCGRFPGKPLPIEALLEAWRSIEIDEVRDSISAARNRAGYPQVLPEHLREALASLQRRHARVACESVFFFEKPGKVMASLVEEELFQGAESRFLDTFVREYDSGTERDISSVQERIHLEIELCREALDEVTPAVSRLSTLLAEWDEINQAVQLLDQARGHEESRSRKIYDELRSLALDLANEHEKHDDALTLTKALLYTFPELESAAEQLKDDISALNDIINQKKKFTPLLNLTKTVNEFSENPGMLIFQLKNKEAFKSSSRGKLGELATAFNEAISGCTTDDMRNLPWLEIRRLALSLNNEHDHPEAAYRLLDAAITYIPNIQDSKLAATLKDDRKAAFSNFKWRDLRANIQNPEKSLPIIDELIPISGHKERQDLEKLKKQLSRSISKQRGSGFSGGLMLLVVGVIAFAIFLSTLSDKKHRPRYSPPSTTLTTRTDETRAATRPTIQSGTSATTRLTEVTPPIGTGRSLTTAQLRYCVFQSERLDMLRGRTVGDLEIRQFNNLIGDYNSRCGDYLYRPSDLALVRSQLATNRQSLRRDADQLLASWRGNSGSGAPRAAQPERTTSASSAERIAEERRREIARQAAEALRRAEAERRERERQAAAAAQRIEAQRQAAERADRITRIRDFQLRLRAMGMSHVVVDGTWNFSTQLALSRWISLRGPLQNPIDKWSPALERELFGNVGTAGPFNPLEPRPPANVPPRLLNIHDRGDARLVQQRLVELGFYTGPVDGIWDFNSRDALLKFKKATPGLPTDESWSTSVQSRLFE